MTINSFDQKLPSLFYTAHLAWRLQYFLDNYVLPKVVKKTLTKQEKDKDVTMVFLDGDMIVLRYLGEDLGSIIQVGSDFTFIKK